ncbi:MAG: hypothetical protein KAH13_04245 [Tenericutes bacterium]|nr:hypothetical protein [Mycoplasmatota bacterium]
MESFNIKKAFKYDGLIRQFIFSLAISILIGIYLYFISKDTEKYIGFIFLGISGLAIILLVGRLLYLSSVGKAELIECKAKVIRTFYYRGTKRVKFTYLVDGIEYTKVNTLNHLRDTRSINKEDELDIYVNNSKPKQALIKDFYFDIETSQ